MAGLVSHLNLIFNNAMLYNPAESDYHMMASALKEVVTQQHERYGKWLATKQLGPGSSFPPLEGAEGETAGAELPPTPVAPDDPATDDAPEPAASEVGEEEGGGAAEASAPLRSARKRAAPTASGGGDSGRRRSAKR